MDKNEILKLTQNLDTEGNYVKSDLLFNTFIKKSQRLVDFKPIDENIASDENINQSHRVLNTFVNWATETRNNDKKKGQNQNLAFQKSLEVFIKLLMDAKSDLLNIANSLNILLKKDSLIPFSIRQRTNGFLGIPQMTVRINKSLKSKYDRFEDSLMIQKLYGKSIPSVQKLYMDWSEKERNKYGNMPELQEYLNNLDFATYDMAALTNSELQKKTVEILEINKDEKLNSTSSFLPTETGTGVSLETTQGERLPADVQNYVGLLDSLTLIDDFPRSINQLTTRTRMVDSFETNLNKSYENRAITPDQYSHLKRQLVRMRKEIDDISKRIY